MATTKSNTDIVPQNGININASTQELAECCPVQMGNYCLTFHPGVSEEELLAFGDKLLTLDKQVTLRLRFWMGDWYNTLSRRDTTKKEVIEAPYGTEYYNLFRTCGWVAGKWSPVYRDGTKTWNWHRLRKNVGGVAMLEERQKAPRRLTETHREQTPEGELIHCMSRNGTLYTVLAAKRNVIAEESGNFVAQTDAPTTGFTYERKSGYGADLLVDERARYEIKRDG